MLEGFGLADEGEPLSFSFVVNPNRAVVCLERVSLRKQNTLSCPDNKSNPNTNI